MTWMWDCECIELAFDPAYDVGGESADLLFSRARRRTPGHLDEDGFVDRPGGRALRCDCCGYLGGPYVPMCPLRPHGVTGLARGDMYERLACGLHGAGAGAGSGTSRRHMLLPMPCLLQVVFASRTGEISGVFESQGLILGVLETTMRCSVRW